MRRPQETEPENPQSAAVSAEHTTRGEIYRGDDPDIVQRVTNARFTRHELDIVGNRPLDFDFQALHIGRLAAYDLSYGTDVRTLPVEPTAQYVIRLGHTGRASFNVQGKTTPFSPSILNPGQAAVAHWDADTRTRFLCVPRRHIDAAVRSRTSERHEGPLIFENRMSEQDPAVAAWLGLARRFATGAGTWMASSPLAIGHFERLLVDLLISVQPGDRLLEPARTRRTFGLGPLRRAMAFCEANAHRPISVSEMAAVARVSVRTLQAEFRRSLDTTPIVYLRDLRLRGARDDLLEVAAGRSDATITEIANKWGFPQRRYFTASYARAFGRLPSEDAQTTPGSLATRGVAL
ncbi:AraC family transcriptional regulator [Yinghuangia soli]|uniref:AraC family transcriptional regulator n=1 Tax=Yinghuangia soli TaxID=2908204 RepID=A0AA41U0S1_9ACTN|nr:AraC family transcriptional regulator [Yinghuangia soli]MCF2526712.1 AraC family transcriptional regulator [Yinghuangia soli]